MNSSLLTYPKRGFLDIKYLWLVWLNLFKSKVPDEKVISHSKCQPGSHLKLMLQQGFLSKRMSICKVVMYFDRLQKPQPFVIAGAPRWLPKARWILRVAAVSQQITGRTIPVLCNVMLAPQATESSSELALTLLFQCKDTIRSFLTRSLTLHLQSTCTCPRFQTVMPNAAKDAAESPCSTCRPGPNLKLKWQYWFGRKGWWTPFYTWESWEQPTITPQTASLNWREIRTLLERGHCLSRQRICLKIVYLSMLHCWHWLKQETNRNW